MTEIFYENFLQKFSFREGGEKWRLSTMFSLVSLFLNALQLKESCSLDDRDFLWELFTKVFRRRRCKMAPEFEILPVM